MKGEIKLYVASRASIPARSAMWRILRDNGHNIISTWIDEAGQGQTENMTELWQRIVAEVKFCDRLVLYVEKGDFPLKGAFIEAGIALAENKQVYVVSPQAFDEELFAALGSWIHHPLVIVTTNMNRALSGT